MNLADRLYDPQLSKDLEYLADRISIVAISLAYVIGHTAPIDDDQVKKLNEIQKLMKTIGGDLINDD